MKWRPSIKTTSFTASKEAILFMFGGLLFLGLFFYFTLFKFSGTTHFDVRLRTDKSGIFKVYWAGKGEAYSEENASKIRIDPQTKNVNVELPAWRNIEKIRIHPTNQKGATVTIGFILIRDIGFKFTMMDTAKSFRKLAPVKDIENVRKDENGMVITSGGRDPQLELQNDSTDLGYVYGGVVALSILFWLFNMDRVYRLLWSMRGVTLLGFLFMAAFTIFETPFNVVLEKDAYLYITKAFEITKGNWYPLQIQFMGWPIVLAAGIELFHIRSIFDAMVLSRAMSIGFMALSVFPLAGICKKMLNPWATVWVLLGFILSHPIRYLGGMGYTEGLFFFLTLLFVHIALPVGASTGRWIWAAVVASLCYYVRANGIFLLPVLLFSLLIYSPFSIKRWALAAGLVIVFFLVSFPHLYLRYEAHGSPFDNGPQNNFFIENYMDIWDPITPKVTFEEYRRSHSLHQMYGKFVQRGLLKVLKVLWLLFDSIWNYLLVIGVVVYPLFRRTRETTLLLSLIAVFIAGISLVWDIHHTPRYLVILLPFAFVIGAGVVQLFAEKLGGWKGNIPIWVGIVAAVSGGSMQWQFSDKYFLPPRVEDAWAVWAARNVEGNIVLFGGGSLLDMCLPEDRKERIHSIRIKRYNSLGEMLKGTAALKLDYLFLTPADIVTYPYLKDVEAPAWKDHFSMVRFFPGGLKYRDMKIYKITNPQEDPLRVLSGARSFKAGTALVPLLMK